MYCIGRRTVYFLLIFLINIVVFFVFVKYLVLIHIIVTIHVYHSINAIISILSVAEADAISYLHLPLQPCLPRRSKFRTSNFSYPSDHIPTENFSKTSSKLFKTFSHHLSVHFLSLLTKYKKKYRPNNATLDKLGPNNTRTLLLVSPHCASALSSYYVLLAM